jgi:hypothetical protein
MSRINSWDKTSNAITAATSISRHYGTPQFQPKLLQHLQDMGLQASQQVFHVDWPYGGWRNNSCVNVHSILPSPRGDGKEAILLVTPLNMQDYQKGKECLKRPAPC